MDRPSRSAKFIAANKMKHHTGFVWQAEASWEVPHTWFALNSQNSRLFEEWMMVFSRVVIFAAWYGLSAFFHLVNPESTFMTHLYRHLPCVSPNWPIDPAQASPFSLPAHRPLFRSLLQPISHCFITVYVSPTTRQPVPWHLLGFYLVYSVSSSLALSWHHVCGMNE